MKCIFFLNTINDKYFYMCPFCFCLSSEINILCEKNMIFYCKNRCKEVILCLNQDFSNFTNDKDSCSREIFFSDVLQIFSELMSNNKNYKKLYNKLLDSRINFIEYGYKYYQTSVVEITNITQYFNLTKLISPTSSIFSTDDEEECGDDSDDDLFSVRDWDLPYLISFNQIQNYEKDIILNYNDSKLGYEGECSFCRQEHVGYLYKL